MQLPKDPVPAYCVCGINPTMQPSQTGQNAFHPLRRAGLVFHIVTILIFVSISAISLWQAAHANLSWLFLLYLLPALAAIGIIIWVSYRLYSLQNSFYLVGRDGIRIHWGLRSEDIPMDEIKWVQQQSEFSNPLPLPILRWPGAVLGQQILPDGDRIEFLASASHDLIIIATVGRYFAISPNDTNAFLVTLQRCAEMGSLARLQARSVYPKFLLGRIWATPSARSLLITSSVLSLILFIWVSLAIPSRSQIRLGYMPDGSPGSIVPAVRLMLLPVINTCFYLANILLGLFFFRSEKNRYISYLLWGSGILTPLLFMIAVVSTLSSG